MPESLYGCRSDAVKLSGFVNHLFCFAKSSVNGPSMSITTDCWTRSIARDEYSTGEFANRRKRPRFSIGAESKPAPASAPCLSRSRRCQSCLLCFTCRSVVRHASWTIDHLTRPRARVLSAIDDHLSVHEHVINPDGIKKRLFIRGSVLDRGVVEDDDVSPRAFFDHAARVETHARRRPGSHFANGLLECQHALFANVARDEAREVAIAAWVSKAQRVDCIRIQRRARVAADAGPGKLQRRDDVLLAHHVIDRHHAPATGGHEIKRSVRRRLFPFPGDLRHGFTFEVRVLF